ncbi:hypothetical protein [Metasolibacillus meyeri]|uniref:hypothetical protein n=1 Tax=Metasolibacillus meyeri TaxID=1071052 RepID=UPI000D3208DA|nr:hypothetical protein [Metasolibacillus meyeri]
MEYKEKFIICLLVTGGSSIHVLVTLIDFLMTTTWYYILQCGFSLSLAIPALFIAINNFKKMKEERG